MIQKHNRHMSFSLYISVLAITDTVSLLIGKNCTLFSLCISHAYKFIYWTVNEFSQQKSPLLCEQVFSSHKISASVISFQKLNIKKICSRANSQIYYKI